MAKFKVKKKDYQLSVRVTLALNEKLDEACLDNFTRKFVRGLLKAKKTGKKKIEYTGPIAISLSERLKKPIGRYDFFFIMEQFIDLNRKTQQAGIDINHVVVDIDKIFINEQTKEMQFVFLPLQNRQTVNLFELMYAVIYMCRPSEEKEEDYISDFTYFLRGMKFFEADKIENYISKQDRKVVNIIKKHNVGQSGFMTDKPKDYYEHYDNREEATGLLDDEKTGLLEDEEATGLLADEEATGLLNQDNVVKYATMFRVLTNEIITINKPVFRIGKEKSYCDYFVSNNNAVSRSHADIIIRGEKYLIMDLNSTNRTYINNAVINPRQEIELHDGDSIKLGNEEFIFRL